MNQFQTYYDKKNNIQEFKNSFLNRNLEKTKSSDLFKLNQNRATDRVQEFKKSFMNVHLERTETSQFFKRTQMKPKSGVKEFKKSFADVNLGKTETVKWLSELKSNKYKTNMKNIKTKFKTSLESVIKQTDIKKTIKNDAKEILKLSRSIENSVDDRFDLLLKMAQKTSHWVWGKTRTVISTLSTIATPVLGEAISLFVLEGNSQTVISLGGQFFTNVIFETSNYILNPTKGNLKNSAKQIGISLASSTLSGMICSNLLDGSSLTGHFVGISIGNVTKMIANDALYMFEGDTIGKLNIDNDESTSFENIIGDNNITKIYQHKNKETNQHTLGNKKKTLLKHLNENKFKYLTAFALPFISTYVVNSSYTDKLLKSIMQFKGSKHIIPNFAERFGWTFQNIKRLKKSFRFGVASKVLAIPISLIINTSFKCTLYFLKKLGVPINATIPKQFKERIQNKFIRKIIEKITICNLINSFSMISSQVIASYATNCVMDQNYESIDDLLKDMNETIKGMTSNMSDSDLSKNLNTPSDFLHNMLNPDEFKNKYKSMSMLETGNFEHDMKNKIADERAEEREFNSMTMMQTGNFEHDMKNKIAEERAEERVFNSMTMMETGNFEHDINNKIAEEIRQKTSINQFKNDMYNFNIKRLKAYSALGLGDVGETINNDLIEGYNNYLRNGGTPLSVLNDQSDKLHDASNFKNRGLVHKILSRAVTSVIPGGQVVNAIKDTMNLYQTADLMNDVLTATNIVSKTVNMDQVNGITNNIINNLDLDGMSDEYDGIFQKMEEYTSKSFVYDAVNSIGDATQYNSVKAGMAIGGFHPSYTRTRGVTMVMLGDNTVSNTISDIVNKFLG